MDEVFGKCMICGKQTDDAVDGYDNDTGDLLGVCADCRSDAALGRSVRRMQDMHEQLKKANERRNCGAEAELARLRAENERMREALEGERSMRVMGCIPNVHMESLKELRRKVVAETDSILGGDFVAMRNDAIKEQIHV